MRSRQRLIEVIDTLGSAVDEGSFGEARYLLNWAASNIRSGKETSVFLIGQLFSLADEHPSPHVRELASECIHYSKAEET